MSAMNDPVVIPSFGRAVESIIAPQLTAFPIRVIDDRIVHVLAAAPATRVHPSRRYER